MTRFGVIFDQSGVVETIAASPRVSLDGRSWLAGDIRLDGGAELRELLSAREASDELLCLQAYAKWGIDFLDHLAGDFCFAVWDDTSRQLICARDQLGVRPLFYGRTKRAWLIGNSLAWIVAQVGINHELDDLWIADFLSVGYSLEFERTAYRHICRLPPGHSLTISSACEAVRRYWQLDIQEPIYYSDRGHYVAHFTETLTRSIADRLPAGLVGISLSGGLDSSTLAACAVDLVRDASQVTAETSYFSRLIPDDEQHFSSLVARRLNIGHTLRAMDDLSYDPDWRIRPIPMAEPTASVVQAHHELVIASEMATKTGVWFHGEGPDNALLFEGREYLRWLFERHSWRVLAVTTVQYLGGRSARDWATFFRKCAGYSDNTLKPADGLPPWLDRGFVRSLHLEERYRDTGKIDRPRHPWHPRAIASFNNPIWQSHLGGFDPAGSAAQPLEWRHPYLDLRVLRFLLSVPPIPWARHKFLLREAMRGRLPKEILTRKKTPLAQSPLWQAIRIHGLPSLSGSDLLSIYVDEKRLPTGLPGEAELHRVINVHALDHWLTVDRTRNLNQFQEKHV